MVRQNKADGIIGLTYNSLELDEDLPFVSIDRSIASNIPCVTADNYGGGRIAAEALIKLGCRSLAFLRTGSASPSETDRRGDGFEATCRIRNIPCYSLRLSDGDDMGRFRDFSRNHMSDGRLDIDGVFCSTIVQPVQKLAETAVDRRDCSNWHSLSSTYCSLRGPYCWYVPRNKARRAWADKAGVLIARDGFITGNSATAQALVEREMGKTQ